MKKKNRKPPRPRGGWTKGKFRPEIKPRRATYWWRLRQNLQLTQQQLADKLGVHRNTISRYEDRASGYAPDRGRRSLYEQLAKAAHLFFAPPPEA